MGTVQSTQTTMEINDLPFEGKEASLVSLSGRKQSTIEEDIVLVDIPMISTVEDEEEKDLDHDDEEEEEEDFESSSDDDEEEEEEEGM